MEQKDKLIHQYECIEVEFQKIHKKFQTAKKKDGEGNKHQDAWRSKYEQISEHLYKMLGRLMVKIGNNY